jgi:hypothetical protein
MVGHSARRRVCPRSPDLRGGRLRRRRRPERLRLPLRRGPRTLPRIRIPGEHTRDRSVLVGKLAEILRDQRPTRKVTAMFIDMAFGSPIYERLRALGFNNVFETNFGLVQTPDRTKANMRAFIRARSNLLVLESQTDMQKRDQASPTTATRWC